MTRVERAQIEAGRWQAEQIPEEFGPLLTELDARQLHHVVEIGVRRGGTSAAWHELSTGTVVGVELPEAFSLQRGEELRARYSRYVPVFGSSHERQTYDDVHTALFDNVLGETHIDLLFLDGDHSYEGVKQDFEMYGGLVKPGGVIVFHDIVDSQFIRDAGHGVYRFWAELQGKKHEHNSGGWWGGIGVYEV